VTNFQGKSSGRRSYGLRKFDELRQDVRYALRQLARAPLFTVMAAVTLAIGVAANSTTFGLIDAIMFRPPAHVRAPEKVGWINGCYTYNQYTTLAQEAKTIDVAAICSATDTYGSGLGAEKITVKLVTHSYYPLLGTKLIAGRIFLPSEDAMGASDFVAIIGYNFWYRHFHGDFSALGQRIQVRERFFTIIGIAPKNFRGAYSSSNVDVWLPLMQAPPKLLGGRDFLDPLSPATIGTIARIHEGVPQSKAEAEMDVIFKTLSAGSEKPLRFAPIYQDGMRKDLSANDSLSSPVGRVSIWLVGASLLVLLISCANVAGLLLIRSVERRHELAIRMQLGAGRGRIIQQLLIETILLAILGGMASLALLTWTVPLMLRLFPTVEDFSILDHRILLITSGIAAVSVLMAGIIPALQSGRAQAIDALKEGMSVVPSRSKFRDGLLIVQVAMALALAVGAGLFVRSIWAVASLDYGYDIKKVLVVRWGDWSRQGFSDAEIDQLYERMMQRLQQSGTVESVALGNTDPMGKFYAGYFRSLQNQRMPHFDGVTPGYFATLGTRILRGRAFMPSDTAYSTPVAIVSESLAKSEWGAEDPIGHCAYLQRNGPCIRVIGVSETRRRSSINQIDMEWFIPLAQVPDWSARMPENKRLSYFLPKTLYVRVRKSPAAVAAIVKSELPMVSANMPFMKIMPMESIFDEQTRSWNLGAQIFTLFGVMALTLAGVGIYGALAFSVRQRTAEIGVRMAMGAKPADILGLVFRHGFVLAAIGLAIGIAASMALCRILQNLLFGIQAMDSVSFLAASTIVLMVAGLACAVPALRAMRIDPAMALRRE
jgi:predicted permease